MKAFVKSLRYAFNYKWRLALAVALAAIAALLRAASLGSLAPFLDIVFSSETPAYFDRLKEESPQAFKPSVEALLDWFLQLEALDQIAAIAAFLLFIMAFRGILVLIHESLNAWITAHSIRELADDVYHAVLRSPMHARTGDVLTRFSVDLEDIRNGIRRMTGKFYMEPFNLMAITGLLIYMHTQLALISMTVFPAAIALIFVGANLIKKRARKLLKHRTTLLNIVEQGIRGLTTIRIFGLEEREFDRFSRKNENVAKRLVKLRILEAMHRPILEIVGSTVVVLCLITGSRYVLSGELSGGTFIVFYAALVGLIDPIRKLSNTMLLLQRADAASERVFETVEEAERLTPPPGGEDVPSSIERIELKDVSVVSQEGTAILQEVSCELRKGSILCIAGLSGAGKSTFLKLIPRLLDPTSGQVLVDGRDLREFDLVQWRTRIGYVGQEPFLFGDTVTQNIRAGQENATDREIESAAEIAQAAQFVSQLPERYETPVDDRKLSAGERQRLTVARAILRTPSILILDEATSALDQFHESRFLSAVWKTAESRITVIVTHRLDTVPDDASVILLREGRVVGQGIKKDLVRCSDHFRDIVIRSSEFDVTGA